MTATLTPPSAYLSPELDAQIIAALTDVSNVELGPLVMQHITGLPIPTTHIYRVTKLALQRLEQRGLVRRTDFGTYNLVRPI